MKSTNSEFTKLFLLIKYRFQTIQQGSHGIYTLYQCDVLNMFSVFSAVDPFDTKKCQI